MWKKSKKLRSSALAILLAVSMIAGVAPGGMGQVQAAEPNAKTEEDAGFLDKAKGFFSDMGEGIVNFFTGEEAEPAAAFDEKAIADPSTIETWEDIVKDSTENIGRIWTDKTVSADKNIELPPSAEAGGIDIPKGDSDFLVGLSALSSTSNTVETVSKPLDIVLLLDRSGSMANEITVSMSYTEVYNLRTYYGPDYFIQLDGEYKQIKWHNFGTSWRPDNSWAYQKDGEWIKVTPRTSRNDANPEHVQAYEGEATESTSRMQALTESVENFINATAKMNASISENEQKHRISIVSYASSAENNASLTYVEGQGTETLIDEVKGLRANGGTQPEEGLRLVQQQFQRNPRENAKKVVVFFTDGGPGGSTWNPFDPDVANETITEAKSLKDDSTLIYSVGVIDGADPEDTSSEINAYMHAVSSNYPKATTYRDLGAKVSEDADYYKAATNAEQLNDIFTDISEDLNEGLGFPTQTPTQGYDPGKTGYITFTDRLGDYMQVDEFKTLVFADKEFRPVGDPVTEDDVTTYKYEGTATGDSELYPNGNVRDIIVQVKKGADLKTGDTVTVQIPAGLIPLRHFTVDEDINGNKTMQIDEAYPLRIFYGVSIKPEVQERIAKGLDADNKDDEALQQYMNSHNEEGVPQFYSNYYDGSNVDPNGKKLGNTTAKFQPSKKNSFYYFTTNTPIYEDADCTTPVKSEPSADKTYYYKRPYVEKSGNAVADKEAKVAFAGKNFDMASTSFDTNANGEYYIKAGSARLTRVDALVTDKKNNETDTAEVVIDPIWDNVDNPDVLNVYLGNNGKLALELPGALAISKDARVAANKNLNADEVLKDKEFTFEIRIPSMQGREVHAEVRNAQNDIQGEAFTLTFNSNGIAERKIKNDETLYIHGLDEGAEYTVTEKGNPAGFDLTAVDGNKNQKEASGTIVSGQPTRHVFENTYDVDEVTLTENDFAGYEKRFVNEDDWKKAKEFQIDLIPTTDGAPLPEGAEGGKSVATVTEEQPSGKFGAITFDRPDTYNYVIREKQPENPIPGVVYSLASYTYRVIVKDNGDGSLSATSEMVKTATDTGAQEGEGLGTVENKTAVFTNDFSAESTTTAVIASKAYTDHSGNKPLTDEMFEFKFRATGDNAANAPMPAGVTADADGYIHTHNDGQGITFGQMTFDQNHIGTWTYEFSEVIPTEAVPNEDGTYTFNGMTYDPQVYTVSITAEVVQDENSDARIVLTKTYMNAAGTTVEEADVRFTNSYTPQPIVLPGDGAAAVQGRKTLVGRNSLENEEFTFNLTAANTAARTGLEEDFIIFNKDESLDQMTATVSELTNNKAQTFDFDSIEFKRPGTYVFYVNEEAPANGNGMVYDRHTAYIRITVTDDYGTLKAETAYYNGEGLDTDAAAFVNQYTANVTYGTGANLIVEKTLDGRDLKADEFTFHIAAVDGEGSAADKKLTDSDREFSNTSGAADGVASQIFDKLSSLNFTQDDAGQTFSYIVSETEGDLPGVTYSQDTYQLDIQVVDNGNGTMHTVTNVIMKGNGGVEAQSGPYDSLDGKDTIHVAFTNGYHAEDVDVEFTDAAELFNKQLVGRNWKAGDAFTFTLEAEDGAPMPKDAEGKEVKEVTVTQPEGTKDGTKVPFGFGTITYDAVGRYTYTVKEKNAGQVIDGVTYSNNVAEVTVQVTDPGDGQLHANVQTYSTTFVNEYSATLNHNAAGGIVTKKTLTGHALAKDQFTFQVEALDGTDTTAEENAKRIGMSNGTTAEYTNIADDDDDGVITMKTQDGDDLTFTSADIGKTFKYEFSEKGADGKFGTGGTEAGYTYDDTVYTVELWVTDENFDGMLTLHTRVNDGEEVVSTADAPEETVLAFNNSYAASGDLVGETALTVTKVLSGRDWLPGDTFNFKLEATGDTLPKVTEGVVKLPDNANTLAIDGTNMQHKASFGNIEFTKPGTYTFKVSEIIPDEAVNNVWNGITYDNSVKNITVEVTDNNDGTLTASVLAGSNSLVFTNTYTVSSITLDADEQFKVTKNLAGREWTENDAFEFTLVAQESAPMPEGGKEVVTATKGAETQTFGEISYTEAGTYTYNITETVPETAEEGMTYDTHTATVTVVIEENFVTGTLSVKSVTYSDGEEGAQFTNVVGNNTKDAQNADGESLNNGMIGVGDELTYVINWVNDGVDETGAPAAATVTITDQIPEGTEFVSAGDGGVHKDGTVTWTVDAEAAETGSVSFKVKVTEAAGGEIVENQANIQVGENDPKVTNTVQTTVPGKDSVVEGDGELQVGSVLNYTISYMNPEAEAATVTITDVIPAGLDYVDGSAGENATYDASSRTLTWTLENVLAGQKGTVTFQARVNESAETTVENKATIQIGENSPEYSTNTDSKPVPEDGSLAISKTIALTEGQGTEIDTEKAFEFTVALTDNADNALTGEYAYTITNEDGNVSDRKITHNGTISLKHGETATITGLPAGTKYTVTETNTEGYTPDAAEKSGSVKAEDTAKADFTNTYSVTGSLIGNTALNVVKNFTGREGDKWLENDKFTFTLTAADEATQNAIEAGLITLPETTELTIDSTKEDKQAAFGDIKFNIAGTFKFNVTEQESGIAGVTDDAKPVREIVVNVVDNKDGKLNATVAEGSDNLTFENTYSATTGDDKDVAADITATKTLTGRDMKAGEFKFEVVIKGTDTLVATGTNATANNSEAGAVVFGGSNGKEQVNLKYTTETLNKAVEDGYATKEGNVWTVNYTAREKTNDLPGGVIEGKTSFDFSIVVTDNEDGVLAATVQYPEGGIAFTNVYNTTAATLPGAANLKVKKEFTGKEWTEEAFKFTLTQTGGDTNAVTMPEAELVLTKDEAEKAFGDIAFDAAGNYQFTVKEVLNDNGGVSYEDGATITYDNHAYVVDVQVTDNGVGQLVATPTVQQSGSATFKNTFNPAKETVTLAGTKAMTGRELRDTDKFQFTIKALTEGAPLPAVTTVENVGENISFAPITYDVPETEAVYEYEITEEDTTINGVSKDSGKVKATVTITYDAATGTTAQKVEYAKEGGNGGEGFAFVNKYEASPAEPIASIEAVKAVTPSEGNSYEFKGGEFDFTVTPSSNNDKNTDPIPEAITVQNDKDGKILIAEKVVFTAPGTYEYTVAEKSNGLGGMTYDDTTYKIQVVVSNDEGNAAQLTTTMTITNLATGEQVDSMTFNNNYNPKATSVTFDGTKKLNGKALNDGDFSFVLEPISGEEVVTTEKTVETVVENEEPEVPAETTNEEPVAEETVDGEAVEEETTTVEAEPQVITETVTETSTVSVDAPMPKAGKETVTNTGSTFTFGTIQYTAPGTFKYRISEVNDGKTGYTYDDTVYEITVVVTDENGVLKATVTGADAIVFNNSYKALPITLTGEAALKATKTLEGRDLKAEEFEFELKDKDGEPVQTVKNDAEGNVTFGDLTFEEVGTFYYTISEKGTGLGGITYDETVYTVKVDVADKNGQLDATVTYLNGDEKVEIPTFANTYKAAKTEVTLGASKVYEGDELKDEQFTFQLKDKDGKVVSKAKNTKDGQVAFETITYDEAGTYEYTISEKNDKQKDVTYDETVYAVTVTVTDNGEGSLLAEVAYKDGKAPVFKNKYTKPAEPTKPEEPKGPTAVKTGDTAPVMGFVVMMVAALVAIVAACVILFRRRRR